MPQLDVLTGSKAKRSGAGMKRQLRCQAPVSQPAPGGRGSARGGDPRPGPRRALGSQASLNGGRATRCNLSTGRAEHGPHHKVYSCYPSHFFIRKINTILQTSDLKEVRLARALLPKAKQSQDGGGRALLPSPPRWIWIACEGLSRKTAQRTLPNPASPRRRFSLLNAFRISRLKISKMQHCFSL